MLYVFARILAGVVIDTQIVQLSDPMDLTYIWIDITNMSPRPEVGWLYDGSNFTDPDA